MIAAAPQREQSPSSAKGSTHASADGSHSSAMPGQTTRAFGSAALIARLARAVNSTIDSTDPL
ncbi:hypothetical protein [Allokutzneria multivorans]|uniref:hypothetical protein n=1 Tax=Allokutzneria multivorans TaxID=1142134 RepID=UPI0031EC1937